MSMNSLADFSARSVNCFLMAKQHFIKLMASSSALWATSGSVPCKRVYMSTNLNDKSFLDGGDPSPFSLLGNNTRFDLLPTRSPFILPISCNRMWLCSNFTLRHDGVFSLISCLFRISQFINSSKSPTAVFASVNVVSAVDSSGCSTHSLLSAISRKISKESTQKILLNSTP